MLSSEHSTANPNILQINQATALLRLSRLLLCKRRRTKRITARTKTANGPRLRRRNPILRLKAGKLRVQERIGASLVRCYATYASAGRVDKGPRCGVLCGDAQLTDIAKCILAFACGQQRVELGSVRVKS